MKNLIICLILCLFTLFTSAQVTIVYRNKVDYYLTKTAVKTNIICGISPVYKTINNFYYILRLDIRGRIYKYYIDI